MHKVVEEPQEKPKGKVPYQDLSISEVSISPGAEETIIASKGEKRQLNAEVAESIMKVEEDLYSVKNTEKTFVVRAKEVMGKIKDKLIALFLLLFPNAKRPAKLRKDRLDSKAKKSLGQFKELASLYVMYCQTDDEMLAYEFAFDKIYFDLVTYSEQNGYDEKYFSSKMTEFINIFEP